ncbi:MULTISPECIES: phosphogluconate dehydrogenase (NAD(+)-dependent, decarboxylating) [Planococcaceae]|uniref:Decarboxylating 6-phosphogluconate dehydrogenase n=1 Tax=Planococcus halotolerans TaxID=2233542 RepID=A0A365L711_9BACL|nr:MULTISPECIES: decarboxylating 6-phosphogluconate dehydrogenase [Planococcaceae]RAZ81216.1 decarboxylating 6-phosphogluconate dehydrogenase [Planococcus halotolerans]RLQ90122.1 decarboxylating 6-phosphogluconate dehydrogenase [Planomicrobium sp. Y74]
MKLAMIGVGKMGYNLALNMMDNGHQVVAHDANSEQVDKIAADGAIGAYTLEEVVQQLEKPRVLMMLVPHGEITENVIATLKPLLDEGDIIIDGGNSNYKESVRLGESLKEKGIHFMDCGTSGGVSGAREGICTMIGGDPEAFKIIEPVIKSVSVENGYFYTGELGSGHFLKMIHNGIEYGMMQAMAEGFDILEKSDYDYDLEGVAKVWNNGSVIRSWLMELVESAFSKDPKLEEIRGVMNSSGEGKWTVETALDLQVPAPVITMSLLMRYRSQEDDTFTGKVVAALRNEFGGHAVVKK